MADIRVSSWNELNERLYEGSWSEELRRFRSNFAFRGMASAGFDLKTSLMRLGGAYDKLERNLLRNFRKYAQCEVAPGDSVWGWLAVAQHHGLPTRLLDWTFSPFFAMHFATERFEHHKLDGAIWCVDLAAARELLPARLKRMLLAESAFVFTVDMLQRAAPDLTRLGALNRKPFLVFYEPPSVEERVAMQFALFSVMSTASARLDEFLHAHPRIYRRIIIPAKLKWEVRDKLDQAGITERMLFPGLDGLSRWLTRYYAPRTD
jgi:hypothetical protein